VSSSVEGSFVMVLEIEVEAMGCLPAFIRTKRYNNRKEIISTLHHTG
jgi:hypothetical protein